MRVRAMSVKSYFGVGHVPIGIGAILRGWDLSETEYRAHELSVVDGRIMTDACPRGCTFCFTKRRPRTLTLPKIKNIIDEIAEMGARAINLLGEGEPTIDPWFFDIIEHIAYRGMIPVVFTEAAIKMRDRAFVRRVKDANASVGPKCDSFYNADYQNKCVVDRKGTYFNRRNEAIMRLEDEGFNEIRPDGTTRMGFDMVISSQNIHEVPRTLKFCRDNNFWLVVSTYLPTGKSGEASFDQSMHASADALEKMREEIVAIDASYGFVHPPFNNFGTGACFERLELWGNGDVSACAGNDIIIGNVHESSVRELHERILQRFPGHDPKTFDGHCLYRPRIPQVHTLHFHPRA